MIEEKSYLDLFSILSSGMFMGWFITFVSKMIGYVLSKIIGWFGGRF